MKIMVTFGMCLLSACSAPDFPQYFAATPLSAPGQPIASSPETPGTPFQLEVLEPAKQGFTDPLPALQPVPKIKPEQLFKTIYRCFPTKPKFDLSVKLEGGATLLDTSPIAVDSQTVEPLGQHYVKLVASMPLIDNSEEHNRQLEREYQRRVLVGKNIADFVGAIAERNTAARQLGLYQALEQRAQLRVQKGLAPVPEQVSYLEKVIATKETLIKAETHITQARLALVGQCGADHSLRVADYLKTLAYRRSKP